MTEPVLSAAGLGKCYTTYKRSSHRFLSWLGIDIAPQSEYWAVRDVNFVLQPGAALGLIGQNGAGKSTLLKLVTGTVKPTTGAIGLRGRVCSILELGLGFNPEFTGRENIYHSGGLLGFSAEALDSLMTGIEDFAEIGDFIDQPLRVYSSGMQARLAFSLITAVRPDILIVDEVLSVGDSYFQHKSFDRIRQFKAEGTSILLVTHGLGDVRSLCDRVLLMDKGQVIRDGDPGEVIDYYNAMIAEKESAKLTIEQRRAKHGWVETKSGTGEVIIRSLVLRDAETKAEVSVARTGQELELVLKADVQEAVPALVLGFMLRHRNGHVMWGTNTWHTKQIVRSLGAGQHVTYTMGFSCMFGPGSYSFSPALVSSDTHFDNNYEWRDNMLVFDVINSDRPVFIGSQYLPVTFQIAIEAGTDEPG
ncbi:ABC transporter ATP-binding protein [Bradyrhizobium sp. SZCCHNPS1003]|uniref:ABC transporter ATP-binding protein n=1 Tax=Bradyrhizobium sp. SZCCHNPS1003 TaxID=3057330 RepID=UPI0028EB1BB3|nr:ABC transporter ATP-binding protein [Bradyrhizobium sp. SZCCHNPS1003]